MNVPDLKKISLKYVISWVDGSAFLNMGAKSSVSSMNRFASSDRGKAPVMTLSLSESVLSVGAWSAFWQGSAF
jgi:hypothetical protein